jgi:hypothetical protein
LNRFFYSGNLNISFTKSLRNICSDQQKNNYAQYKDGIVYYKSFFLLFINIFTVVINFVSDFRLIVLNLIDGFMVFNATFNNISAISWLSVLLVKEMGVPGENNRSAESHVNKNRFK